MQGFFSTEVTDDHQRGHDQGRADGSEFAFIFTIVIDDLDRFLSDESREARIIGTVEAPALATEPLTATGGVLNLLVTDAADPETRRMHYRTTLTSRQGKEFFLDGVKVVRDDPGFDMWADTTTLYITVREGGNENAPVLGTGTLRIRPTDFAKQATTMRGIGVSTLPQRIAAVGRFSNYFARSLMEPTDHFESTARRATHASRDPAVHAGRYPRRQHLHALLRHSRRSRAVHAALHPPDRR